MSRKDKSSDGERLRQASVKENPDDKLFLNSHAGIGEPIDFIMSPFYTEGDIPLGFTNSGFGRLHRWFACLSKYHL